MAAINPAITVLDDGTRYFNFLIYLLLPENNKSKLEISYTGHKLVHYTHFA
jgi:hypothetical protein